jgi:hypothetical protein
LQDGGYLRHKQAKAQKGQFTPVQYHLFEAPTEERGGESHESHDDQSQPWIAGGISRATWFRQKAGNPSAAETPTASRKTPSGETQRSAGISGNGEAGNPCATDSLTATPKPTSGETHCAAGGVSHRDEGNPCATDSLTATPFTAQRLSRSPANGALLNTKKRLKTEKDQGEGGSPPGPPPPPAALIAAKTASMAR